MSKRTKRKRRVIWINTGQETSDDCPAVRNMSDRDKTDLASGMKRSIAIGRADARLKEAILATQDIKTT